MAKLIHSDFIEEMKIINPNIKIIGNYVSDRSNIDCKCNICDNIWSSKPYSLKAGSACPKCAKNKRKKSHNSFVEEIYKLCPTIKILGQYINNREKIQCLCTVCNTKWDAYPCNLTRGHFCPTCGQQKARDSHRKSQELFEQEVAAVNPNIIVTEKYVTRNQPIGCQCKICGYKWRPLGTSILKGHGCPQCAKSQTSYLEQAILFFLREKLGADNVLSRDRLVIGKEIDIYIPSLHIGIEPGSWKWHENRIEQDLYKYKLAKQNGIRLIIIYDKFDKNTINNLPFNKSDLITYQKDLGRPSEKDLLINCIKTIFSILSLDYTFSQEEEKQILLLAKTNAVKKIINMNEEMIRIGSNIEVLGKYTGYHDKIQCRCKTCNHLWLANPSDLLRGTGCPECRRKKKVLNIDTNKIYDSITSAAKDIGVHPNSVSAACNGRTKTSGGYRWEFVA